MLEELHVYQLAATLDIAVLEQHAADLSTDVVLSRIDNSKLILI